MTTDLINRNRAKGEPIGFAVAEERKEAADLFAEQMRRRHATLKPRRGAIGWR